MVSTCLLYLPLTKTVCTAALSNLTKASEHAQPTAATSNSLIPEISTSCGLKNNSLMYKDEATGPPVGGSTARMLEREAACLGLERDTQDREGYAAVTLAGGGTIITPITQINVHTRTSAPFVEGATRKEGALRRERLDEAMSLHRRPHYTRNLIWDGDDGYELGQTPSASATESAAPLPPVPANKISDIAALRTITLRPDLFKIVTPINIDHFSKLLKSHPNRLFVNSVGHRLRHGFWPYADTLNPEYPPTWDNSARPIHNPAHVEFLREQRDKEICLGRWSKSFGDVLLPSMYAMPLSVVPKPHSAKLQMVNNHSAGEFSLNAMIDKADAVLRLDGIRDLSASVRKAL